MDRLMPKLAIDRISSFSPVRAALVVMFVLLVSIVATPTTAEAAPTTVMFQQGVGGYTGTYDTTLVGNDPTTPQGSLDSLGWDLESPSGSGLDVIGLIRFDNIFGAGTGQIPVGSTIVSATLSYQSHNPGDSGIIYEAAISWDESTTYNGFGTTPGAQPEDLLVAVGSAEGTLGPIRQPILRRPGRANNGYTTPVAALTLVTFIRACEGSIYGATEDTLG